jgi:hypothetical protein
MVVDNRGYTGTKAGEELLTELAGSAEVNNRYPNGRRDSFDTAESALTGEGSVFFTHVDSDHLSGRALEQAQREGLRGALYVPMFLRGQSMENSRFNTLTALADSGEYEFDIQNLMCSLLPQNVKGIEHITNGSIADFLYSLYLIDNGTESPAILEVFRHLNPRNTNADGAIYRYTYKGISWLLPGDFDDERALTELLEASEENVKKRAAIGEEITRLNGEAYAIPGYEELMEKMTRQTEEIVGGLSALAQRNNLLNRLHSATGEMVSVYSGELIVNEILAEGIFYELESLENELAANPAYQQWSRINDRITELNRTYSMLPALRSHYLKWPHHAHIFKDGELYGKIKSAVNPFYTIFQPHPTQKDNLETFKALLKEHGLEYLDSSEHPVEMQSFEHRPRPGCRAG